MNLLRILGCAALLAPSAGCDTDGEPEPQTQPQLQPQPGAHGVPDHNGPQNENNAVTVPFCRSAETVLASIDTPLGVLIPRQLAEASSGSFRGTWSLDSTPSTPMVPVTVEPSAAGATGSVSVQYAGGVVRHIQEELIPCDPGAECVDFAPTCLDRLEIEMQLSMNSDNGVLAEQRVAILSVLDPRDPDLGPGPDPDPGPMENHSTGWVKAIVDPGALMGSGQLKVGPPMQGFTLRRHALSLSAQILDNKLLGASIINQLEVESNNHDPGAGVAGAGAFGLYRFHPDP